MLQNLKKVLGIEGLRIDLVLPQEVKKEEVIIHGKIIMTTLRDTQVTGFTIKAIEKYSRGRGKNKSTNEYIMGQQTIQKNLIIKKGETQEVDFVLPYQWMQSEMDKWQDQNFIYGGLISLAKKIKAVHSEFYILAEAKEAGTKLSPHATKTFMLK